MTHENNELEGYLQRKASAGSEDGTSTFTLNKMKARLKLASAQLPKPELWVVKMVQAAVAAGAPEISFQFGRKSVTVEFSTAKEFTAESLVELAESSALPNDPFYLHLTTAIRSSVAQDNKALLITTHCGSQMNTVRVGEANSHTAERGDSEVPGTRFQLRVERHSILELMTRKSASFKALFRRTADENFQLLTRCWCSPIPIKVDGRFIDTRYDSPLQFYADHSRASRAVHAVDDECFSFFVGLRSTGYAEGQPMMPSPKLDPDGRYLQRETDKGDKIMLRRPIYRHQTFLHWVPTHDRCQRVVGLRKHLIQASWLSFVCDGAVVQRVPICVSERPSNWKKRFSNPATEGLCIAEAVNTNDLDLSQFRVRNAAERRKKILVSSLPLVREIAVVALLEEKTMRTVSVSPQSKKPVLAVSSLGGLATCMALSSPFPLLGFGFLAAVLLGEKGGNLQPKLWLEPLIKNLESCKTALPMQPDMG